jgi:cell wall-associated NlpC family hydrolase
MTAPALDWSARYVEAEIPWLDEDRGWAGTNCHDLIRLVFREDHGLALKNYGPARDRHHNAAQFAAGKRIPPWIDVSSKALRNPFERRPYDLVGFEVAGRDDHCGLVVTPTLMLHLSKRVGVARLDEIDRWGKLSCVLRHEALA